jgi:[ribosomal protein S5]-alanine N-acetyltransferase
MAAGEGDLEPGGHPLMFMDKVSVPPAVPPLAHANWRAGLPEFVASGVTLREVRLADASSLLAHLSVDEVSRFISPPPTTIEGFEDFLSWCHRDRAAGLAACFAVVPPTADSAVGLFQVRALDAGFQTAEWGFALGSAYWGSGLFLESATRVLDFSFDVLGIIRLEARAAVVNGRGNGALRKTGAVQEGVLRRSFLRGGQYHDQVLWSILAEDWRLQRGGKANRVH